MRFLWAIIFLSLFVLGFFLTSHFLHTKPTEGDYSFKAQSLQGEVSLESFRGQYVALYFGYTSCPDVCPLTLSTLSRVLNELDNPAITLLFISLDPARDELENIDLYVKYFYPPSLGLRVEERDLAKLAIAYGLKYQRIPLPESKLEYSIAHSSAVYLFDTRGEFVQAVSNLTYEELKNALTQLTR